TIGWLASRLGFSEFQRESPAGTVRRWRARRRQGGTVMVELENRLDGPSHGVAGVELSAGGDRWTIERANQCLRVDGPSLPVRVQPARQHTDVELVVSGLGVRGRDPIFRDALAEAARLVAVK